MVPQPTGSRPVSTAQAPMVPQPMGNRPVSTAQAPMAPQPIGNRPISYPQPIPPLVSQPVKQNVIYTINSYCIFLIS